MLCFQVLVFYREVRKLRLAGRLDRAPITKGANIVSFIAFYCKLQYMLVLQTSKWYYLDTIRTSVGHFSSGYNHKQIWLT